MQGHAMFARACSMGAAGVRTGRARVHAWACPDACVRACLRVCVCWGGVWAYNSMSSGNPVDVHQRTISSTLDALSHVLR
jgi:hypothetical protein